MIYTSRFQNKTINNREHIPVRISRYHPRFRLGYKIEEKIDILMPTKKELFEMPPDKFEAAYRRRIKANIAAIREKIEALKKDGRDILLLCYEDIYAGQKCHRRLFAEIWHEETGEEIREL